MRTEEIIIRLFCRSSPDEVLLARGTSTVVRSSFTVQIWSVKPAAMVGVSLCHREPNSLPLTSSILNLLPMGRTSLRPLESAGRS